MENYLNILIVDDDAHFGRTLSDILSLKGYRPFVAHQGKFALDIVRENTPSIVLIDLILPDMDGLTVMREIKEYRPNTECILLTGHASQTSAIEAVNMGAYSYVQKPYDIEQLLLVIRRAMEKQKAENALMDSEGRYRLLFNSGNDAVMVFHILPDGRLSKFIEVNDVACQKLGYPKEESRILSFDDIEAPENQRDQSIPTNKLFSEKHILFETTLITKNQISFPVEINSHLFDFNGCPTVLACARDITERKRTEKINRTFSALGYKLNVVTSPKEAAKVILSASQELFGWDAGFISYYSHEDDKVYDLVIIDMIDGQKREIPAVSGGKGVKNRADRAMRLGSRLILRESGSSVDSDDLVLFGDTKRRSATLMYTPIKKGDAIVGLISIQSYRKKAFSQDDLKTLEILADYCGGAMDRIFTEARLQESEEKLRLLTEQIPSILWTTDTHLRFTLLLGAGFKALHLNPDQMIGKSLSEFFSDEDSSFIPVLNHKKALEGKSATYEMELGHKFFHSYIEPLRNAEGNIIGCISVAHDITDRIHSEEALRKAHEQLELRVKERTKELSQSNILLKREIKQRKKVEENLENSLSLLRATLESTTDGVLVVNNYGVIVNYNQRFVRMWKLTMASMKKRDYQTIEKFCLDLVSEPGAFQTKVREMSNNPETSSFDIVELKDDRILERYSMPQRIGEKTVGRVWSFRDVTRSKRAEDALARSEAIYREAIEKAAGVPYRLFYKNGNYDFVGEGIKSLFGVSPDQFSVKELRKFIKEVVIVDPDAPSHLLDYIEAFQRGEVDQYRVDLRILTRAGEEKWVSDCSVPIRDSQTKKVIGSLGILQDVTKRKRMEEQARHQQEQLVQTEKMVALGILVSGVAHEINNPNNFIMLNVPTLLDSWSSISPLLEQYYEQNGDFLVGGIYYSTMRKHVPELFNCILAGANRIKNIVRELRDFARESDATQMELVDINAVVKSSLTLLENMIKKSTNYFSVDYCDKIPKIKGNFQRLEQVVINLIQNACQALSNKDQAIFVSTRCDFNKDRVVLEIGDKGSGIPSEIQKYIMDPFFTTKREKGGVGLGLSISSKIINEHKGILGFKSKPGAGTIATIKLPIGSHSNDSKGAN